MTRWVECRVFISYRRNGQTGRAQRLAKELRRLWWLPMARTVFLDDNSIDSGGNIPDGVSTAIEQCWFFVVLIDELQGVWCQWAIRTSHREALQNQPLRELRHTVHTVFGDFFRGQPASAGSKLTSQSYAKHNLRND